MFLIYIFSHTVLETVYEIALYNLLPIVRKSCCIVLPDLSKLYPSYKTVTK